MADAATLAREQRATGRAPNGTVGLRAFDEGLLLSLGGKVSDSNYFVQVPGVQPPPGFPGVPLSFTFPEDVFEKYRLPFILINRDDLSPALQRWHPGAIQYRAPAPGALPIHITDSVGTFDGFSKYEQRPQAFPFDITYSISLYARYRSDANALLDHAMRKFPPYGALYLFDDQQDPRSYDAFAEGVAVLDDVLDVTQRLVGFILTVRVESELDLSDPLVSTAVRKLPMLRELEI